MCGICDAMLMTLHEAQQSAICPSLVPKDPPEYPGDSGGGGVGEEIPSASGSY